MPKSIAIIGAGIAGLSAGCYARMNGFDTTIFELHDKPGGLCTSWERDGYVVDGCLHWLCGSSRRNSFHRNWRELGALDGVRVVDHEEFVRVEEPGGKTFIVYTDIDRFEKHLLELAPGDRNAIRGFADRVRLFARSDEMFAQEVRGLPARLLRTVRAVPFFYRLIGSMRVSLESYAARFKDPFVRRCFTAVFDLPDFPMLAVYWTLGMMNNRAAGYPLGGSLEFARRIERRYLSLGGVMRYQSRVRRILVEDGRAVGVTTADGEDFRADYVISAADGHSTLYEMLEDHYLDPRIHQCFQKLKPFPPLVYIAVGIGYDLSDQPHSIICRPDCSFSIPGRPIDKVYLRHFCYDPSLAPPGKSVLISMFPTDYAAWKDIASETDRYEAQKRCIADQFVGFLQRRFPEIKDKVEMVDVATPMTFERYTGNWQGSFEGWLITTKSIRMRIPKKLRTVRNLHLIGQWVQPGGGVPTGAMHGRAVIQAICRENRLKFQTTEVG